MKRFLACSTLVSILLVGACSGGGGGGGGGTPVSTKLTLSGIVDSQATGQSGSSSAPVANATVTIVDASGNSQTVQTDGNGNYSAQVNKLTVYGVSVTLPSSHKPSDRAGASTGGPINLKAVAQVGSNNITLNVTAASTAAVIVLQQKYNITVGSGSSPIGTKLDNVDVNTTVSNIYNAPTFPTLAVTVANDIKANTDPTQDSAVTSQVNVIIPVVTFTQSALVCPSGQTLVSGVCTTTTPVCTSGQTLVNNVCTTPAPTSCPSGQTLVNGVCTTSSTGGTTTGGTTNLNDPSLVGTWVGSVGSGAGSTMVFTATSLTMTGGPCPQTGPYSTTLNTAVAVTVTSTSASCPSTLGLGGFTYTISGSTLTVTWPNLTPYSLAKQTTASTALVGSWYFTNVGGNAMWGTTNEPVGDTSVVFSNNGTYTWTMLGSPYPPHNFCQNTGTWSATAAMASLTDNGGTCGSPNGNSWFMNWTYVMSGTSFTLYTGSGSATMTQWSSPLVGAWIGQTSTAGVYNGVPNQNYDPGNTPMNQISLVFAPNNGFAITNPNAIGGKGCAIIGTWTATSSNYSVTVTNDTCNTPPFTTISSPFTISGTTITTGAGSGDVRTWSRRY